MSVCAKYKLEEYVSLPKVLFKNTGAISTLTQLPHSWVSSHSLRFVCLYEVLSQFKCG